MKRSAISKRLRFSVFSRDGFTCKYCGRQSDSVKLVIDHIKPVCDGGTNEETNLITACEECNQGKSGTPLPKESQIESHRLSLAQEFQEQNALNKQAVEATRLAAEFRQELCNLYCEIFSVDAVNKSCLSRYITLCREVGNDLLIEWFKIASSKHGLRGDVSICKYINGIHRNFMKGEYRAS